MVPKGPTQFYKEVRTFKKEHKSDILSIKALYNGTANEMQQKRALSFIIKYLCRADEINYYPDAQDTAFALGRESIGKFLRGLALDSDWVDGNNL